MCMCVCCDAGTLVTSRFLADAARARNITVHELGGHAPFYDLGCQEAQFV